MVGVRVCFSFRVCCGSVGGLVNFEFDLIFNCAAFLVSGLWPQLNQEPIFGLYYVYGHLGLGLLVES